MSLFRLSGIDGIDVRLCLPRFGCWHADVTLDVSGGVSPGAPGAKATLAMGNDSFNGTVRQGGAFCDVGTYRLVGGAGGLGQLATPKAYYQTTPSVVVQDILNSVGETLSATVDINMLAGTTWAYWTTPAWPVGQVLTEVVQRLGCDAWRVLPDGTVWLGFESWPTISPKTLLLRKEDRLKRRWWHILQGSAFLPGTTFYGERLEYVRCETLGGSDFDFEVWVQ